MAQTLSSTKEIGIGTDGIGSYLDDAISSATIETSTILTSTFPSVINSSQKIDLQMLWKLIEQGGSGARVVGLNEETLQELDAKNASTTWQLAIIQGVLLAMLVVLSILWAFCCRRIRDGDQPLIAGISSQMAAIARKISSGSTRDLPPSYSKVDLTQVGLTVNDHLNPPPHYEIVSEEDLTGQSSRHLRRLSRFSLSSVETNAGFQQSRTVSDRSIPDPVGSGILRPARFSVGSTSSIYSADSESSSRRTSRVTFGPVLELGPMRRESSQSLPLQSAMVNTKGRKSSSHSEGSASSRRVSFIDELTGRFARPDPLHEERLRTQLEIVREAGELGEFVTESQVTPERSQFAQKVSSASPRPAAIAEVVTPVTTAPEPESKTVEAVAVVEVDPPVVESEMEQKAKLGTKQKRKSFCNLPEDDLKNRELFI